MSAFCVLEELPICKVIVGIGTFVRKTTVLLTSPFGRLM